MFSGDKGFRLAPLQLSYLFVGMVTFVTGLIAQLVGWLRIVVFAVLNWSGGKYVRDKFTAMEEI